VVWVFVFGGIALAGLIMLICWIVWLAHKVGDVMSEVGVLADRTSQILDLLGQIQPPEPGSVRRADTDLALVGEGSE
jgi:hypothetical protein